MLQATIHLEASGACVLSLPPNPHLFSGRCYHARRTRQLGGNSRTILKASGATFGSSAESELLGAVVGTVAGVWPRLLGSFGWPSHSVFEVKLLS